MKSLRRFEEYMYQEEKITFQDVFPGKKDVWVELSMEERIKLKHEVFEIIDTTYRSVFPEGHVRIQKEDDVINNKELVFC